MADMLEYIRKKRREQTEEPGGVSSADMLNYIRERNSGEYQAKRAQSDIENWYARLNEYGTALSDAAKTRTGYQNASDIGRYNVAQAYEADKLRAQSNALREKYKDYADVASYLDEGDKYLDDVKKALGDEYNYWAQFKDEDEYYGGLAYRALADADNQGMTSEKKAAVNKLAAEWKARAQGNFNEAVDSYRNTYAGRLLFDELTDDERINAALRDEQRQKNAEVMSEDELAVYAYLLQSDPRRAAAYADYFNEAQAQYDAANISKFAQEAPITASVISALTAIPSGAEYIAGAIKGIGGGKYNPNDYKYTNLTQTIRSTVSRQIEEKAEGFWGKAGSIGYNVGMSMADFLLSTAVTGGFSGAKTAKNFALGIMGSRAASSATVSAKERGLSDKQAYVLGLLSGAAEIVTEKISLENLLNPTLAKDAIGKYLIKNMLAEGSEEVAADALNLIADALIAKDKAEIAQAMKQYQAEGLTEKEAWARAIGEQAVQMGISFLGGALSGGVMAGVGSIAYNAGGVNTDAGGKPQTKYFKNVSSLEELNEAKRKYAKQYADILNSTDNLDDARYKTLVEINREASALSAWLKETQNGENIPYAEKAKEKLALPEGQTPAQTAEQMNEAALREVIAENEAKAPASQEQATPVARNDENNIVTAEASQNATEARKSSEKGIEQKNALVEYGKNALGKNGAEALEANYGEGQDISAYAKDFTAFYNAGKNGTGFDKVSKDHTLTDIQAWRAFDAGQADNFKSHVENGQIDKMQYEVRRYSSGKDGAVYELVNVQGIYDGHLLHGGGNLSTNIYNTGYAAFKKLVKDTLGINVPAESALKYANTGKGEKRANVFVDNAKPEALTTPPANDNIEAEAKPEIKEEKETRNEQTNERTVADGRTKAEPDMARQTAGGLLDAIPSEDVRGNEERGNALPDSESERRGVGERGSGDDTERVSAGRGERNDMGGDTQPAAGEITEETEAAETVAEETQTQEEIKADVAETEDPRGNNYVITSSKQIPNTPKSRYEANVKAIKVLRALMEEDRAATGPEQTALGKYTGWGGISEAFDENKTEWAKEYKQLQKLLSPEEYKTAKASILDAYYTEPEIISAMYKGLAKIGFDGGRLLEPSAGVGRFIGAMPEALSAKVRSFTAVELDKVTGNIAKYLYPQADVRVQGFETAKIPDNYIDLAIGNVPFGNFGIADKAYPASVTKSIHNYFIAKSLDKVRPGGLLAVITTSATMDNYQSAARDYFMTKADLIGAVRLPNTAFKGTGTSVISDILIFKKRPENTLYKGEEFKKADSATVKANGGEAWGTVNEYFVKHPEMILGVPKREMGRYGYSITYNPIESKFSLATQIERAIAKIKAKMEYPEKPSVAEIRRETVRKAKGKNGSIQHEGGKFYINDNGEQKELTVSDEDSAKLKDILGLRDSARKLLDLQLDGASEDDIKAARAELNRIYDGFVSKNGVLNLPANKKIVALDSDSPFIMALENDYDGKAKTAKKAAIFTRDTVKPNVRPTSANSIGEALTVSMNETGTIELQRMAELLGETAAQVERQLIDSETAFKDRNGELVPAEIYLSGNVKAKLKDAEALAEGDKDYKHNVEALKKIIPEDIPAERIGIRMGATWIPENVYADFIAEMLGTSNGGYRRVVDVSYNRPTGEYHVTVNDAWLVRRAENTSEWGTTDIPFAGRDRSIVNAALNHKTVTVWQKGDGNKVINRSATAAAQEKLEKVLEEFKKWLWKDEKRKTELTKLYNDVFNNSVTQRFDGSGLTVDGLNAGYSLKEHQANAVQRILNSGGNTLLAHRVGAGKTLEMAAAIMKLRQIGVVKKPIITVPKHIVAQWGNEFINYFPAARILVAEENDFTPENRKTFANRIATGDYDAIIMSYEQFGKLPMSAEHQNEFYQEQIDRLVLAIETAKREKGKNASVKDLERSKKNLEAKMKKLEVSNKDEDNIEFEQLGVDAVFVDEAHNFKNLFYSSKMSGVADLGTKKGSQRAFDLYQKIKYLQKLNGGRGVVFATATPVMNSVVELYTMQRYLQADLLEAKGISDFDAWADEFGEVMNILKLKASGNGYEVKQSLSRYKNLNALQQMISEMADVITDAADLPYLKIPTMKGGKRIVVECEPSEFQKEFMQELGERAEALKKAGKNSDDHIFKVFNDGKKISYTQRLADPDLPYEDGGKIMRCVENVLEIWKETETFTASDGSTQKNGTQLIFCDRGTPGGAEAEAGVSIYDDIKNLLVAGGIPADQIAFIHSAKKDKQKAKLFADVNEGRVRVLIGSTAKMGTGVNAQKRIVAMHELNAPDRPGDLEQNEGRALRQGNLNDEVEVYAYVTKGTFDSKQWDNLKRKAAFIYQIMSGKHGEDEAAGDGELVLSAAEISAIASDNPLIIEQFEVSSQIAKLENLAKAHLREISQAKDRIVKLQKTIADSKDMTARLEADIKARVDTSGDKFSLTVNGETFKERKAAGEAVIAAVKKVLVIGKDETRHNIGKFAGFDLVATSHGDLIVSGKGQYRTQTNMQSAVGTIQSLEAIPRRFDKTLEELNTQISESEKSIKKFETVAASSFDREDELIKARVREREIMEQLNPPDEKAFIIEEEFESDDDDAEETGGDEEYSLSPRAEPDVREWTAERVGSKEKVPKSISQIIEQIRHDFGFNITTGHIRRANAQGQFNVSDKGIRSKVANDLPTISHELGHALDDRYGIIELLPDEYEKELLSQFSEENKELYNKNVWKKEAFAEFFRRFLQNRTTAAIDYPTFTPYFLNKLSGTDAALVEQLADEVNAYYSLDADTATSSIRLRSERAPDARTLKEKFADVGHRIYQAFVDSNHAIKLLSDETGSNAYILATNAAYAEAAAWNIITGELRDINGKYIGPGLKAALTGLDLKDDEQYLLFNEYLKVRHGPERLAEGMRVFGDDRKDSEIWCKRREAEIIAEHPEFEAIADRLYEFDRTFWQVWGIDARMYSDNIFHPGWKYYVPLNRALDKESGARGTRRSFANQTGPIKRARGGGQDTYAPVDNIIYNMAAQIKAAILNNVMLSITESGADATLLEKVPTPLEQKKFDLTGIKDELTEKISNVPLRPQDALSVDDIIAGLDDFITQYGRGKAGGNVVTVMKNGKPEFWKINDPLLMESIMRLSPKKMKGVLDAYAVTSRFMTGNITGNNIIWSLFSNFPRDLMTFFTLSPERNPLKVFKGIFESYANNVKGDKANEIYKEFRSMGGGIGASAYTADRELTRKVINKLKGKTSYNPLDWFSFMSDAIETGPRYALYKILREKGISPRDAYYASNDVTVNFARGGYISRELNQVIPFFNASVQGLDKFGRWLSASDVSDAGQRKKTAKARFLIYLAVSALLGGLFYALNNYNEEAKKNYQQLSNYTKNTYWLIPLGDGKYFAVPKPRELAVIASFFEALAERTIGGNKHAFDEFGDYAADQFLPNIIADVITSDDLTEAGLNVVGSLGMLGTAARLGANKDFLGRPIVSSALESYEPKQQYTDRTSKLAYWIGQAFNLSPQKIDYFFENVLGGWWKAQKALLPVGSEEVDFTLGIQNSYVKDNQYSTDLVNWLYNEKDKSQKAHNSDMSNIDKSIKYKMDSNMQTFYSRYYSLAKGEAKTVYSRDARQVVLSMISEYRKSADVDDTTPEQKFVNEVCKAQNDTKYLPDVMQTYVRTENGDTHTLSPEQYVEYQTEYNKLYWDYIEANAKRNMTEKEKAAIITSAKYVAKARASENALKRMSVAATAANSVSKFGSVSDQNIIAYKAKRDIADDDGSLTQNEVISILKEMIAEGLSKKDASQIFQTEYSSNANNPWRGAK